jgi:hypothetical protein
LVVDHEPDRASAACCRNATRLEAASTLDVSPIMGWPAGERNRLGRATVLQDWTLRPPLVGV